MITITEVPENAARTSEFPASHRYRLVEYPSDAGVERRIDLFASSVADALASAIEDHSGRKVDIWEDGEFACGVTFDRQVSDVKPGSGVSC